MSLPIRGQKMKTIEDVQQYKDVQQYFEQKSREYGSKKAFFASKEYAAIYPAVKAIYDKYHARQTTTAMAALKENGIAVGDRVYAPAYGWAGRVIGGVVIIRNGLPYVRFDEPTMTTAGLRRFMRWHKGWGK